MNFDINYFGSATKNDSDKKKLSMATKNAKLLSYQKCSALLPKFLGASIKYKKYIKKKLKNALL